jgi:hypothetical protein
MGILQDLTKTRSDITQKYSDAFDLPRNYNINKTEIKYSENYLNDYINAQKSAGADVLVKTLQKELDKWKSKQQKEK